MGAACSLGGTFLCPAPDGVAASKVITLPCCYGKNPLVPSFHWEEISI